MIENNLKKFSNPTDEQIKEAITQAFDQMENEWLLIAKATFDKGFSKPAYVSSTALVILVKDNKVYVANSGDCKAVLIRHVEGKEGKEATLQQVNLSKTFSAKKKEEQQRLKKEHPGEKDVYECLKGPNGIECYVKGGLSPTRSFGDFRLKHREFNFHNYREELGYRLPIPVYSGPYITVKPDIQVHELTANDKWIILASDGLWDHVPRKDTARLVKETLKEESLSKDLKASMPAGQKIIKT